MKSKIQWKVKRTLGACKDLGLNGSVSGMESWKRKCILQHGFGLQGMENMETTTSGLRNGKQNGNHSFGSRGWKTRWKLPLKVSTWKPQALHCCGLFTGCYTNPFLFP